MINLILNCGASICRILTIACICTSIIETESLFSKWFYVGIGFVFLNNILQYFLSKREHEDWH